MCIHSAVFLYLTSVEVEWRLLGLPAYYLFFTPPSPKSGVWSLPHATRKKQPKLPVLPAF